MKEIIRTIIKERNNVDFFSIIFLLITKPNEQNTFYYLVILTIPKDSILNQ